MSIKTQKLLGRQSLSEFIGLKVDLEKIYQENKAKLLLKINNKKKFVVNEGNNLSKAEIELKKEENKRKYGLSKRVIRQIQIPKLLGNVIGHHMTLKHIESPLNNLSIIEKLNECDNLINCMRRKIQIIDELLNSETIPNTEE